MPATLMPTGRMKFWLDNGRPAAFGFLYSYAAGTSTPLATKVDAAGVSNATNPVELDQNGEAQIWLGDSAYKLELRDSEGTLVPGWPIDNITRYSTYSELLSVYLAFAASSGSSLMGFIQAGAGAVLRTVQSKLRDHVDVKDFGATGDLVANDSAASAAALATGKKVRFSQPSAGYICGALTLSTQGQELFGDGINTVIRALDATINQFTVSADYCSIESMRLNGVAVDSTNSTFAIFTSTLSVARHFKTEDILVSGASSGVGWNNGFKFDDSSSYVKVLNCDFERLVGVTSGHGYGILAGNVRRLIVDGCILVGSTGRGRHAIYFSAGCSYSTATNNYIESFDWDGIQQFSQNAQPACIGNIYSENTLIACVAAGNVTSGSINISGHSLSAKVSSNFINTSGAKGIACDGTGVTDLAGTDLIGNTVLNSALQGMDLIACVRANISTNTIYESSKASAGVSSNIRLISDGTTATSDVLLTGNHSSGSSFAKYALELNSTAPAPARIKAMANFFPTCQTGSILSTGCTLRIDGGIRFSGTFTGGVVANGATTTPQNFTVSGAITGDYVIAALGSDDKGCSIFARGTSADTVTVIATNNTGAGVTIASQTITGLVFKTDI